MVLAIAFGSMALTYGVHYIYPAFFIALEEEFGTIQDRNIFFRPEK